MEFNFKSDSLPSVLTAENYAKGFLIDEELMAGVMLDEPTGQFAAFVVRPTSGEYLGYRKFETLPEAIAAINQIPREWKFESTSECGGCGEGEGPCGKGNCAQSCATTGSCEFD